MNILLDVVSPAFVLSTLLALLWATLWFVWRGGGWRGWLIAVLAAVLGFGAGQLLATLLGSPLPAIGQVHVIEGTLCSWLALWLVHWLRRP